MRRTMQTLMVTGMVMAGLLVGARAAAADSTADYRRGMTELLPAVTDWANEATTLVLATEIKPELACGEELGEIARRGVWLSEDLRGTGELAPAALAAYHETLTNSMRSMTDAAASACADSAAARGTVAGEQSRFAGATRMVTAFVTGLHSERPGRVPVAPGTGN